MRGVDEGVWSGWRCVEWMKVYGVDEGVWSVWKCGTWIMGWGMDEGVGEWMRERTCREKGRKEGEKNGGGGQGEGGKLWSGQVAFLKSFNYDRPPPTCFNQGTPAPLVTVSRVKIRSSCFPDHETWWDFDPTDQSGLISHSREADPLAILTVPYTIYKRFVYTN